MQILSKVVPRLLKQENLSLSDNQIIKRLARPSRDEKIFSLNSGNCGSKYIVELFKANGFPNSFHEKMPDLDVEGVQFYLDGKHWSRLKYVLKLTRHDVFFESNNRFFSLAPILQEAFPQARFIHQHRDFRKEIISTMNKNIWPDMLMTSPRLRYASTLGGPRTLSPFERTCLYWKNINQRILDDLKGVDFLSLRFEDLTQGRVDALESFVKTKFPVKTISPVNTKEHLKTGKAKFTSFEDLTPEQHRIFFDICGATMKQMGYAI